MQEWYKLVKVASLAAAYLRDNLGTMTDVIKNKGTDVTKKIDWEVEKFIIERIKSEGIEGAIVTEERGVIGEGPPYIVVDPLDGSLNFSLANPYASVSIAYVEGNKLKDVTFGVIAPLFSYPIYFCEKGKRERVLAVYFEVFDNEGIELVRKAWEVLGRPKLRSYGSIASDLALLARNKILGVIDVRKRIRNVDIAAGLWLARSCGFSVNNDVWDVRADEVVNAGNVFVMEGDKLKALGIEG